LVGNGIGFRQLGKRVHSDHEILVSLVAPWERLCYIDGYPFEQGPNVVLMHLAPTAGSGAVTVCTSVFVGAPTKKNKTDTHSEQPHTVPKKNQQTNKTINQTHTWQQHNNPHNLE
jgi:hypothetical protein